MRSSLGGVKTFVGNEELNIQHGTSNFELWALNFELCGTTGDALWLKWQVSELKLGARWLIPPLSIFLLFPVHLRVPNSELGLGQDTPFTGQLSERAKPDELLSLA